MSNQLKQAMEKETILNVGFDDTDSPKGMCTTFLAYKIIGSTGHPGGLITRSSVSVQIYSPLYFHYTKFHERDLHPLKYKKH